MTPEFGLPRAARLLKPAEFTAIMKGGRKSRDPFFSVFVAAADRYRGRLGLAVSRRAASRAVVRNRIKRHVRESFRHHCVLLDGLDIVVVAQSAAAEANGAGLRASLQAHWNKARKLCKDY